MQHGRHGDQPQAAQDKRYKLERVFVVFRQEQLGNALVTTIIRVKAVEIAYEAVLNWFIGEPHERAAIRKGERFLCPSFDDGLRVGARRQRMRKERDRGEVSRLGSNYESGVLTPLRLG